MPCLAAHGVALGVQNHCGRAISNGLQLHHALAPFDPRYVGAVWDAAHNAIAGEEPELALDVIWPHLRLVNLKNVFWQRANGPEAAVAQWRWYWTTGPQGLANWPRVTAELRRRGYRGDVCLTAEYSDGANVDRYAASDLAFARGLWT